MKPGTGFEADAGGETKAAVAAITTIELVRIRRHMPLPPDVSSDCGGRRYSMVARIEELLNCDPVRHDGP
jgi:hypothetical protein